MLVIDTVDDLQAAVNRTFGPGEWVRIDQARVSGFAEATGDHQWIHVDLERARRGPFGATIAHGYLTLSLIPALAADLYQLRVGDAQLNYGLNRVRFPHVVRVGDAVRLTSTILGLEPHRAGRLLTMGFTLEIEGQPKPGCIAETLTLLPD